MGVKLVTSFRALSDALKKPGENSDENSRLCYSWLMYFKIIVAFTNTITLYTVLLLQYPACMLCRTTDWPCYCKRIKCQLSYVSEVAPFAYDWNSGHSMHTDCQWLLIVRRDICVFVNNVTVTNDATVSGVNILDLLCIYYIADASNLYCNGNGNVIAPCQLNGNFD